MNKNQNIVIYQNDEGNINVQVKLIKNDLWLSLNQIAELFGRDRSVIGKHLKNIFKDEELERESVVAFLALLQIGVQGEINLITNNLLTF